MFSKLLRLVLAATGALFGYGSCVLIMYLLTSSDYNNKLVLSPELEGTLPVIFALILGTVFFIIAPIIQSGGIWAARRIEGDLQKVPANDIVIGTIGLILGLFIAYLISQLLVKIDFYFLGTALSFLTYIFMGYLGVNVSIRLVGKNMTTQLSDVKKSFVGINLKQKTTKSHTEAMPKILDTSVIIDGRISDIIDTGFIEGAIIIPEFVLEELRHIADSADSLKRTRGRRGLDILKKIQKNKGIQIYNTYDKSILDIQEVDVKLLKLAEIMNGKVVTNDFNLNKVAEIQGVPVLNINEMANALKPVVLHGEEMEIVVVREGKENNQGVAFLDDGTMIVVEEGKKLVGQVVEVIVTSVLQTAAGRMIFAKPKYHK